jgi:Rrf2 family protein
MLATHEPGQIVEARELAAEARLPGAFLSKILQQLAGDGVLVATRGRGYRLARPAEEIRIDHVIHVIEGDDAIWNTCVFWREECDTENPCPLHFRWQELKPGLQLAMNTLTLADVRERWAPMPNGSQRGRHVV